MCTSTTTTATTKRSQRRTYLPCRRKWSGRSCARACIRTQTQLPLPASAVGGQLRAAWTLYRFRDKPITPYSIRSSRIRDLRWNRPFPSILPRPLPAAAPPLKAPTDPDSRVTSRYPSSRLPPRHPPSHAFRPRRSTTPRLHDARNPASRAGPLCPVDLLPPSHLAVREEHQAPRSSVPFSLPVPFSPPSLAFSPARLSSSSFSAPPPPPIPRPRLRAGLAPPRRPPAAFCASIQLAP